MASRIQSRICNPCSVPNSSLALRQLGSLSRLTASSSMIIPGERRKVSCMCYFTGSYLTFSFRIRLEIQEKCDSWFHRLGHPTAFSKLGNRRQKGRACSTHILVIQLASPSMWRGSSLCHPGYDVLHRVCRYPRQIIYRMRSSPPRALS